MHVNSCRIGITRWVEANQISATQTHNKHTYCTTPHIWIRYLHFHSFPEKGSRHSPWKMCPSVMLLIHCLSRFESCWLSKTSGFRLMRGEDCSDSSTVETTTLEQSTSTTTVEIFPCDASSIESFVLEQTQQCDSPANNSGYECKKKRNLTQGPLCCLEKRYGFELFRGVKKKCGLWMSKTNFVREARDTWKEQRRKLNN